MCNEAPIANDLHFRMKRRSLILLLGGASSGAMSVGTGAFSSVEAEREVEVNVVKDENAYLGLDDDAGAGLVQIKNQFPGGLDLAVTAALESGNGAVEVEKDDGDINISIGLSGDADDDGSAQENRVDITIPLANQAIITADVSSECHGDGSVDLELAFSGEVSETGTTVDKTRTFSVDYEPEDDMTDQVTKVKFPGESDKLSILTTQSNGSGGDPEGKVTAKLYCESNEEVASSNYDCVPVNENVDETDFDGDCKGSIIGVNISGIGFFENNRDNGNTVSRTEAGDSPS